MKSKRCKRCLEWSSIENFNKGGSKYGRQPLCRSCTHIVEKEYRKNNVEKVRERKKKYYIANKEKINNYRKKWYRANKEDVLLKAREYNKTAYPIFREKRLRYGKLYREANPGRNRRNEGTRRALKFSSMLSLTYLGDIKMIYQQAKYMEALYGIKYHVDHIIPLKHDRVCGLHVPWNLQVITAYENIRKSNRVEGL